jgi:hypothetical protein
MNYSIIDKWLLEQARARRREEAREARLDKKDREKEEVRGRGIYIDRDYGETGETELGDDEEEGYSEDYALEHLYPCN